MLVFALLIFGLVDMIWVTCLLELLYCWCLGIWVLRVLCLWVFVGVSCVCGFGFLGLFCCDRVFVLDNWFDSVVLILDGWVLLVI